MSDDQMPAASSSAERRIGQGPPPPPHRPTTAVPPGLLQDVPESTLQRCADRASALASALQAKLGAPFYLNEGFLLYNHDCVEVLSAMRESGCEVDLTVTSPPYNIGKDYEDRMSVDEYVDWCRGWMRDVEASTREGGAFWLNVGYQPVQGRGRAVPIAYLLWDQGTFFLQQEVVWHYGAGVSAKKFFSPRNEKWLFFTQDPDRYTFNLDDVRDPNVKYPNQKKNGKYRCNPLGKNPTDVWSIPKVTSGAKRSSRERADHPAQFPLAVVDRIVKVSSAYEDVVLDPFSGSGSAGIAAVGNGRVFVGAEVSEEYCRSSADRHQRFVAIREDRARQGAFDLK